MPYIGDKARINATSSIFENFIEQNCLYIDKTKFIEHIFQDTSDVVLFTRPRRMGKSLNLNTLHTFADVKRNTKHLFKGLYIETVPTFGEINTYPVIYFNFKDYRIDDFKRLLRNDLIKQMEKYLKPDQMGRALTKYIDSEADYNPTIPREFMEVLTDVYGKRPFLLIDEYDKPIFDNMSHPDFGDLKDYIVAVLSSAMKDNPYLGKAVLTGVTRIANESLFSAFNNPKICDVFHHSQYDADFSLTGAEVAELLDEDEAELIRPWYNNMRVGGELLYNIYSVMLYLDNRQLRTYWARTGASELLGKLMTKGQAETMTRLLAEGCSTPAEVDDHIAIGALLTRPCPDRAFYS
ncbi:MAG: AAA family ATPase, partial [Oscillospiraceae bacterium]|nr:AAA family ATPase [Oscillospiraceae bacterium]